MKPCHLVTAIVAILLPVACASEVTEITMDVYPIEDAGSAPSDASADVLAADASATYDASLAATTPAGDACAPVSVGDACLVNADCQCVPHSDCEIATCNTFTSVCQLARLNTLTCSPP